MLAQSRRLHAESGKRSKPRRGTGMGLLSSVLAEKRGAGDEARVCEQATTIYKHAHSASPRMEHREYLFQREE